MVMPMPLRLVVVEHLEPMLSEWMVIEYRAVAGIVGRERFWITNVRGQDDRLVLKSIAGRVFAKSIADMEVPLKLILLDPAASTPLRPEDFGEDACILVGGIMGDFPPKHRTGFFRERIGRHVDVAPRNIGLLQFPIDAAVYVALKISEGKFLDEIPLVDGLRIIVDEFHEVELPYGYPVKNGRVVISEEEVRFLVGRKEGAISF